MSKLSPDQIEAVLQAARPLPPASHAAFLTEVGAALADLGDLGDGVIHRVIRDVQRRHWDPDFPRTLPAASDARDARLWNCASPASLLSGDRDSAPGVGPVMPQVDPDGAQHWREPAQFVR